LFVAAAAFAGPRQTHDSHQAGTDHDLPCQFPQFYGTQI
jgi:hypothetical protein